MSGLAKSDCGRSMDTIDAKAEGNDGDDDDDDDDEALVQRVGRDYDEQDKVLQAAWRKAFPKLASVNEKAITCTASSSRSRHRHHPMSAHG
jgi:hypothetical protein